MTIESILFDLGGTLDVYIRDDAMSRKVTPGLRRCMAENGVKLPISDDELCERITRGLSYATSLAEFTLREVTPEALVTEYFFPDYGEHTESLRAAAEAILRYIEYHFICRGVRPEAPGALNALKDLGFRLGCVSNISSRTVISYLLDQYGIGHLFECVIPSCAHGVRKPYPDIFLAGAEAIGTPPGRCVYVGDSYRKDIAGAHHAGFAKAALIPSPDTDFEGPRTKAETPDVVLYSLDDLVDWARAGFEER